MVMTFVLFVLTLILLCAHKQAFGGLVDHCFDSCVDDFTSKALSTRENGCINRCVQKWMATQQRVSDRFQEHNAQLAQQMNK